MAHCPYDLLKDLESSLDVIRALPRIKEAKPGIFYLKGKGFLHFHIDKENKRWADVSNGKSWGTPIVLPFKPSRKILGEFLKEVEKRYSKVVGK
jgi:hypothetical protein